MSKVMSARGVRTSEFWIGLGAALMIYLNGELGINLPVEAIVTVAGLAMTYIASRTIVKNK